jgi:zinc transport system ATP-binding protein
VIPDAADPSLIDVEALTIRHHRELLLDHVSIHIARGSLHVIVGPNGGGKSTLLRAILGQIAFDGRIVLNWLGSGAIGYVPQSFPVDPTLPVTVEDFLALTRQRRPVCLGISRATRATVAALLERVGLAGLEKRPLAVLSGGELRRVLLAHALDPEPELLILDEPAGGLDEAASRGLERALTTMKRESPATIVMVSHDFDHVRRVADRVTLLDRHVIADGTPHEVIGVAAAVEELPMHRHRPERPVGQ